MENKSKYYFNEGMNAKIGTISLLCLFFVLCSFNTKKPSENDLTIRASIENTNVVLTLQYTNASFKTGSIGFSEAKVSIPGGVFSCQRISSGFGDIGMNRRTGRIDHKNSDAGEYIITYTVNNQSVTNKIVVSAN